MNGLEKMIAAVAPTYALKRQRARVLLSYEAAQNTRMRAHSGILSGPESTRTPFERLEIIKQVRDLEQNDGLVRSIISKVSLYAMGRINYQSQTGDREIDKQTEAMLRKKFARCDFSGRHNFRQLCVLALESCIRDGDHFWHYRENKANGLMIQGIESDRVGGSMANNAEPYHIQGVNVDKTTGRVKSFRVFDRSNWDMYHNPKDVPADDMRQFYWPWRFDQYRGISPFAPVANTARDLKEVKEATLSAVKFEGYHAAIVSNPLGRMSDNDPDLLMSTTPNANGSVSSLPFAETKLQPGTIQYVQDGASVSFLKGDRPQGSWQNYITMLVREIALALNLPFGFVYDMASLGGASARMDAQQAYRTIQGWQQMMIERGMDDAKDRFILEGIADGEIDYCEHWNNGKWQFPPAPTMDAGRESAAGISEIRAGLRSEADWYAEEGKDAETEASVIESETRAKLDRAKAIAEDTGFPVNICLDLIAARNPNQSAPFTISDPNAVPVPPVPNAAIPEIIASKV